MKTQRRGGGVGRSVTMVTCMMTRVTTTSRSVLTLSSGVIDKFAKDTILKELMLPDNLTSDQHKELLDYPDIYRLCHQSESPHTCRSIRILRCMPRMTLRHFRHMTGRVLCTRCRVLCTFLHSLDGGGFVSTSRLVSLAEGKDLSLSPKIF
jgi:hypothetical protein